MKKIMIFILLFVPIIVKGLEYPKLHYNNVIIYDSTDDRVLLKKNEQEIKSIASLTKIMTVIASLEKIDNLEEKVIFTKDMKDQVPYDASIAHLKVEHEYTYKDLLISTILPSGADASIALAISLNGDTESFVNEMNKKTIELDMKNTHFMNVTGLDNEEHYSTAEDVLKLLKYALNNETFKKIYTLKEYTLSDGLKVTSTTKQIGDHLNIDISQIIGSKTGYTQSSEYCISVLTNIKNHDILMITLDTKKDKNMYHVQDVITLIDFINNNYKEQTLINKNTTIKEIPIIVGKKYKINITKDITMLLENDYNKENFKIEYEGLKTLSYLDNHKKIGTIKVYYEKKLIYEEIVLLNIDNNKVYFLIGIQYLILIIFVIIRLIKMIGDKNDTRILTE